MPNLNIMFEKPENQKESIEKISSKAPAVESFFDSSKRNEAWPKNIAENKEFIAQCEARRELIQRLDDVFDRLPGPDISLKTAISQGYITEEQAEKAYDSLSDLLNSDKGYERITLYLPFELLPDKEWIPKSESLQQSADNFRQAYMKSWEGLLASHDVRANFVDGDVLETDQRKEDLPRVVKAAHLIPKLIEKGLITKEYAETLAKESGDELLKSSIYDALSVVIEDEPEAEPKTIDFLKAQNKLSEKFAEIEARDYGDATEKRKAWLKQKSKQKALDSLGSDIGLAILNNSFSKEELEKFLKSPGQEALVEGIRKAVEADPKLYDEYKEVLLGIWRSGESQEALLKTFRQFNQLKIVENEQLEELGIVMPKLAGPFSYNLGLMKMEAKKIQDAVKSVESDPELSKLIFPVCLVFGSRLKGYGEQSADVDLAVFVKPKTPFSEQKKLEALLRQAFKREGVVEFWLGGQNNELSVHNFKSNDVNLGRSSWTHVLFGAAWEGEKDVVEELQKKLLASYVFETRKKIYNRNAREIYLEELERDTLQYRLMHKGYERFYPLCGGVKGKNSDKIDGKSIFWDSGYRQLATRLFARRVFLPEISK